MNKINGTTSPSETRLVTETRYSWSIVPDGMYAQWRDAEWLTRIGQSDEYVLGDDGIYIPYLQMYVNESIHKEKRDPDKSVSRVWKGV